MISRRLCSFIAHSNPGHVRPFFRKSQKSRASSLKFTCSFAVQADLRQDLRGLSKTISGQPLVIYLATKNCVAYLPTAKRIR